MNLYPLEDSNLRSIVRRVIQFYKPSVNQFCQCELTNIRTRLYSTVGCLLLDFLTATEEVNIKIFNRCVYLNVVMEFFF